MANASLYTFDFKELAEILVKKQGIRTGHWAIYVKFGLGAANVGGVAGMPVLPTAMVPVVEIGIQKSDKPTQLTIDAAQVNPLKRHKSKFH